MFALQALFRARLRLLTPTTSYTMAAAATQAQNVAINGHHGQVQAEADEEIFDIYSEDGQALGTAPRKLVHSQGVWHSAVYVMVFNPQGELLIQQRASEKRVCPNAWDLSAAEHLSAGETFVQAVIRGLDEELGIQLPCSLTDKVTQNTQLTPDQTEAVSDETGSLTLQGPLAPRHRRRLDLPEINVKDYEFVETWRVDGWQGNVNYNRNEVQEVRWITLDQLHSDMKANPSAFTPWFVDEARSLGFV